MRVENDRIPEQQQIQLPPVKKNSSAKADSSISSSGNSGNCCLDCLKCLWECLKSLLQCCFNCCASESEEDKTAAPLTAEQIEKCYLTNIEKVWETTGKVKFDFCKARLWIQNPKDNEILFEINFFPTCTFREDLTKALKEKFLNGEIQHTSLEIKGIFVGKLDKFSATPAKVFYFRHFESVIKGQKDKLNDSSSSDDGDAYFSKNAREFGEVIISRVGDKAKELIQFNKDEKSWEIVPIKD